MAATGPAQNPRERLLQTASRLFYAHGLARVGINEVIREAGIARMTLYNHFPSKNDLVREVLKMRIREWQDALTQAIESRSDQPREQLLAVFDVLEERLFDPEFHGCVALNFAAEGSELDKELARLAQGHKTFVLEYLKSRVQHLPVRQPEDLARGLLLIHNGATVLAQLGGDSYHQGDAKRAAAQLIRAYEIRKDPKRGAGDDE